MRRIVSFILAALFVSRGCAVSAQDAPYADTVSSSVQAESGNDRPAAFSPLKQTAPVDVRKVPREKTEALQKSDEYWYANAEPKKPEEARPGGRGLFAAPWFWNLLWLLALCSIIAVVFWYLASSNIRLFRKGSKTISDEAEEDAITDDIFSIGYDREIRKAEEASNYRLAVRLWYLQTLKALADRNLINYGAEKPDGDYLAALAGGRYYRDFFRLTRAFEYTWYGQFALSEEAYQTLRPEFLNFKNSLSA